MTDAMKAWGKTIDRYFAEGRTVSGGKGSGTAKGQLNFDNSMQYQANQQQKQIQDSVLRLVAPYLGADVTSSTWNFGGFGNKDGLSQGSTLSLTPNGGSGIGYDPKALALMRTQFLNNNAQNYQSAGQNLRAALLRRGSSPQDAPVGGDYVRGIGGLEAAMASSQSQGLTGIDLSNLQEALNNKWRAMNVISGQAAQLGQTQATASQGASSALNSYVTAKNTGFLSSFGNAFGGALGKGLGAGLTGGIGGISSTTQPLTMQNSA